VLHPDGGKVGIDSGHNAPQRVTLAWRRRFLGGGLEGRGDRGNRQGDGGQQHEKGEAGKQGAHGEMEI
jgi:hypothetical protein